MPRRPRIVWLRLLIAVVFGSATVTSLFMPAVAQAIGHGMGTYQAADEPPSHHQHHQPESKSDPAMHISCLNCLIHCLGSVTLDEGASLPQPRSWRGDGMADQVGHGIEPACLERPPELRS
jgi:hypothetical protein